ncbi:MAG: HAD family hydrolase [Candidatus Dormibacteraeota bacterium]|nr:HAD family hydrolase [Candidatus Dormibacteraeota bacterium]
MSSGNGRVTVFLDRDGVINRRRPDHVKCWEEFEFLPGSLDALASLRQMGVHIIVITNQAVVGRGLITEEDLEQIHRRMIEVVESRGGRIDRIYACLHVPELHCACRKPGTEHLRRASAELGIDLRESFMVGDSETDVRAAKAAGSRPVLVSEAEVEPGVDCSVVRDLSAAVQLIAAQAAMAEAI